MTTDPDLKKTVLDFFDLWQRQVAAVSRNPDATLMELMGRQSDLLKALSENEYLNTDAKPEHDNDT